MVNAISSSNINPIQMFSALNAFKSTSSVQNPDIQEISEGIDINQTNILENQNIEEIQKFAQDAGESGLSVDDIKYGLTYGRSVIADYAI